MQSLKSYRAGDLTLAAATTVTMTAIELVGRTEKELMAANPKVINPTRSY